MLNVIKLEFDHQDQSLLRKINFHVPVGGLLHLRGANGTGKTTLLKLIAGLYAPSSGEIQFLGQSIIQNTVEYQKKICFVGHKSGVNLHLTVRENCLFDLNYSAKHQDLLELAAVFKLEAHLDKLCGLLSAGQRKQVGLLRLWMSQSPLWLLDEPLVALDDSAILTLMAQLDRHRKRGGAIILTSHQDLPLNALDYQEYLL
ncbi:MAG: heme ABC exporter ATP-binding protein CcmA [Legionellales bacterium]